MSRIIKLATTELWFRVNFQVKVLDQNENVQNILYSFDTNSLDEANIMTNNLSMNAAFEIRSPDNFIIRSFSFTLPEGWFFISKDVWGKSFTKEI